MSNVKIAMNDELPETAPCLLVVDDDPSNLQLLRHILQDEYRLLFAKDGLRAIELALQERPDLILLDVMMPGMTGFEVCRQLRQDARAARIPVIFVTALIDSGAELDGFEAGGADFVAKPVSPLLLKARVRAYLALARSGDGGAVAASRTGVQQRRAGDGAGASDARTDSIVANDAQVSGSNVETAREGFGLALRYRDEAIARHARRAGDYARVLARAAGMQEEEAVQLGEAVALHDLGMIGVADAILHKPGELDEAERTLVRRHPAIGAEIIGEHPQGVLALARGVALTHHERWDGSGYPAGLAGEMIPLAGRIAALADVFDALTRTQSWRPAWPLERALAYLHSESGRAFDAQLVRLFLENLTEMLAILEREPVL